MTMMTPLKPSADFKQAGITDTDISLVSGSDGEIGHDDDTVSDAGKGAVIGGTIGGGAALLAGVRHAGDPRLGPSRCRRLAGIYSGWFGGRRCDGWLSRQPGGCW